MMPPEKQPMSKRKLTATQAPNKRTKTEPASLKENESPNAIANAELAIKNGNEFARNPACSPRHSLHSSAHHPAICRRLGDPGSFGKPLILG